MTMRRYRSEGDYWRIREFLREVFVKNGRRERSWQVYRFDYWRWHVMENITRDQIEDVLFLWETGDGRIVAVLHPEGKGDAVVQIHPELATPELEEEMIVVAERHFGAPIPDGGKKLVVWANEHERERRDILRNRGFAKEGLAEFQRHRTIEAPIPDAPIEEGYTIRALGDEGELPIRSWASWKAFHPDEPDEKYEGWEWYLNIQRAPLYRRDLDLVAVAPDSSIASFTTVWFDDANRTGAFEPVGTAKAHWRRGLAKALMCEGLRRLRRLGARTAHVGSYESPAHSTYASVGFIDYELSEPWVKVL